MQYQLKEFFYISNILSLSRIILVIPIVYLLSLGSGEYNTLIIILCVVAALTDFLDGYLSRRLKLVTELGIVLDPIADKIAMAAVLIALVFFRNFHISIMIYLIARDILILFIGWFVVRKVEKPIMANKWGKLNTTLITILVLLFLLEFYNYFYTFVLFLCYLSILVSGISYARIGEKILFSSRTGKYLYRTGLLLVTIFLVYFVMQIDFSAYPENQVKIDHFDKKQELIEKYAPVLHFTQDEKFYPSSVESFFEHAVLVRRYPFLICDKAYPNGIKEAMKMSTGSDTYIKLRRNLFEDIAEIYTRARKGYKNTVYARAVQTWDNDQVVYIVQYWFFYWASLLGSTDIVFHECDWEMVMIYFDQEMKPVKAGYSQHFYGEVRNWQQIETDENRPLVYISFGGHTSHFNPGTHTAYYDNTRTIALGYDYCAADKKWEAKKDYDIVIIEDGDDWVEYKGYWGIPITAKTPGAKWRHPDNKNLSMWQNPVGWFNQFEKGSR